MIFLSFTLAIVFLVVLIFFVAQQYRLLMNCRRQNRQIRPANVWFQLFPLFGLIYQFIVIKKISDTIYKELKTPQENSIFDISQTVELKPTYNAGMSYATFSVISLIPFFVFQFIAGAVCLIAWIIYWRSLWEYNRKIKQHSLLL